MTVYQQRTACPKIRASFPVILSSSPHIIKGIKSRRMRWAKHVARIGKILDEILKMGDNLGDIDFGGGINIEMDIE